MRQVSLDNSIKYKKQLSINNNRMSDTSSDTEMDMRNINNNKKKLTNVQKYSSYQKHITTSDTSEEDDVLKYIPRQHSNHRLNEYSSTSDEDTNTKVGSLSKAHRGHIKLQQVSKDNKEPSRKSSESINKEQSQSSRKSSESINKEPSQSSRKSSESINKEPLQSSRSEPSRKSSESINKEPSIKSSESINKEPSIKSKESNNKDIDQDKSLSSNISIDKKIDKIDSLYSKIIILHIEKIIKTLRNMYNTDLSSDNKETLGLLSKESKNLKTHIKSLICISDQYINFNITDKVKELRRLTLSSVETNKSKKESYNKLNTIYLFLTDICTQTLKEYNEIGNIYGNILELVNKKKNMVNIYDKSKIIIGKIQESSSVLNDTMKSINKKIKPIL